jgi:ribosomal subunit interface protein
MDLLLKGRGHRVTDQDRKAAGRKLGRLTRLEPRTVRIEVEIIAEKNPRQSGVRRVEATLDIPRKTFRAHAEARDVEGALDRLADKLERQLRDHHGKRRTRTTRGSNRLQSARVNETIHEAAEE